MNKGLEHSKHSLPEAFHYLATYLSSCHLEEAFHNRVYLRPHRGHALVATGATNQCIVSITGVHVFVLRTLCNCMAGGEDTAGGRLWVEGWLVLR